MSSLFRVCVHFPMIRTLMYRLCFVSMTWNFFSFCWTQVVITSSLNCGEREGTDEKKNNWWQQQKYVYIVSRLSQLITNSKIITLSVDLCFALELRTNAELSASSTVNLGTNSWLYSYNLVSNVTPNTMSFSHLCSDQKIPSKRLGKLIVYALERKKPLNLIND